MIWITRTYPKVRYWAPTLQDTHAAISHAVRFARELREVPIVGSWGLSWGLSWGTSWGFGEGDSTYELREDGSYELRE